MFTRHSALLPNELLFKYNSYWGTWSRVLAPRGTLTGRPGRMVEITVAPRAYHRLWPDFEVKNISEMRVRAHGTADEDGDKYVDELPADVLQAMKQNLSERVVMTLLGYSPLEHLNWAAIDSHVGGGGCPLRLCLSV